MLAHGKGALDAQARSGARLAVLAQMQCIMCAVTEGSTGTPARAGGLQGFGAGVCCGARDCGQSCRHPHRPLMCSVTQSSKE